MNLDQSLTLAQMLQAIFTVIGIISAGAWTFYNFGLSRSSSPKIQIKLTLKAVTSVRLTRIAILALDITNTGRTKVPKEHAILALNPIVLGKDSLAATRVNPNISYLQDAHEILQSHTFLEPAEQYHEEHAFVVDDIDILQVGIFFKGRKTNEAWEASYLFDVQNVSGL